MVTSCRGSIPKEKPMTDMMTRAFGRPGKERACGLACLAACLLLLAGSLYAILASEPADASGGYDAVEQEIHDEWEASFPGEGPLAVEIARCEGWNAAANFDIAFISRTSDVGPFQINQIHGRPGGIIEGRWPIAAQTLQGNIAVALELRRISGGFSDWSASRHCWAWAIGLTIQNQQEPEQAIEGNPSTLAYTGIEELEIMLAISAIGAGSLALAGERRRRR